MKKNGLKMMERICTVVALSTVFVKWPYCTLILNQPEVPEKLKYMNKVLLQKEFEISECSNM